MLFAQVRGRSCHHLQVENNKKTEDIKDNKNNQNIELIEDNKDKNTGFGLPVEIGHWMLGSDVVIPMVYIEEQTLLYV